MIAVVITCYNYERYVEGAIRSVLDQNCDACELVVIDDGSTDASWDIIGRTGVRAFRTENRGQRAACLYGLERTSAPFILFLDADDECKPGALKTILKALDPSVAKLQFSLTCIDDADRVIRPRHPVLRAFRERDNLAKQVLRSAVYQTPPTSGNVFRRDVCELLSECDYDRAVDGVILFAAPFMGDVISLPEDLGIYRIHDRNDSGLGRLPDASTFERDLRRFLLRAAHLKEIIRRYRPEARLIDARETYYFHSTLFCAAICAGRRLSPRDFLKLLWVLASEPHPIRQKAMNAAFCLVTYLAPLKRAKALLACRLSVGERSARSLLRAAMASG
ncbi:glycosyltransferase family 2 protein [Methylobacterium sp. 77]|uniref:glycosyltransferase family 2 protein n=1 Tax=Methylobacterium sp. 77 TaxID=1101192 RepID=UPI00036627FB|nr:glycosyltransferase family 2 protein [Methylobacterium sp. 77]